MKYSVHDTRDNRYFRHGIQIHESMLDFHTARIWLTETYGFGDDLTRNEPLLNGYWAFHLSYSVHMIYVKGNEELSWFKMKFGETA